MRLIKVQIQDFRCIEDSSEFNIDPVTCLVGKNESGKTTVLKALHKLKSDTKDKESFIASKDYPKRKWRPDTAIPSLPHTIDTSWEMNDDDISAIAKLFGDGIFTKKHFTHSKGFDNIPMFSLNIDHVKLLQQSLPESKLSSEEMEPLSASKSVDDLIETLKGLSTRTPSQETLLADLIRKFPRGANLTINDAVAERIPTFLYFDQYLKLPGIISVNEITTRKQQGRLTAEDEVFIALLSLAGTTLEAVNNSGTYEEFNSSLRSVSNQITEMIFRYWSQNKHLDVDIRLDAARPQDPPPYNSGFVFRTRITNRRHRADTSFDDRSSGFVWFFSFLVWFNELRKRHGQNLIILLDEPGLTLHARAQGDLLRYINTELRPNYQVIYTTHSPFMIDTDNLLSARTVEDVVKKVKDKLSGDEVEVLLGTKVSHDVLSTDVDTISPLQKALDYELTQTLFVGRHTLLVEGPSDLAFLKWFSRQLANANRTSLDYRWSICVGGGVTKIPGFVSLFRGNGLNVVAITDVQAGDKAKIENARKALPNGHLITVDTIAGQSEADIEDVLGREFYIELVNKAMNLHGSHTLPVTKPTGVPSRVVKEVELACATLPPHFPEFGHFIPAEWLYQKEGEGAKLPGYAVAMDRMEKLFSAVNALL